MINRADTITAFEGMICNFVPFCTSDEYNLELMRKVLDLLKEQKPVKPVKLKGYNPPMYSLYEYECEECKSPIMNQQPYCMGCGGKVEWE